MNNRFYKWGLLGLLSGAFFFHQADRALFGILTGPICEDLALTKVQIGWINTALSWTLAGMAFIAGPVGDRFSRKWVITLSLMSWSVVTFMMGFVGDWHLFGLVIPAFFVVMFFRSIATGVGESFYGPCYPPLIATYHRETRSLALSIHQGALYFGLMSSGVITAWVLKELGGWREVFMAFGAAGFLLGLSFIWLLKDTPTSLSSVTLAKEDRTSPLSGFACFFRTPSAWCAMAGFIAIVFVNNAYLFWAPLFMKEKFGVTVETAGAQTMFYHHLFAFAAILIGGAVTDRLVKRHPRFRLGFQIVSLLLGAPCLFLTGYASTGVMMIVMSALYGVFRGCFEVNTHASLFDVIPPEHRSTSVGIFTVFAFFFGGLSGILMGSLSDRLGVRGFEIGFAVMAAAYALAAAIMMISFFRTFARDRIKD